MEIYTIGFTKKSAADFFDLIKANGIRRLVDVRLNNSSQLAGFTKRDDLAYLLSEICAAEYVHEPALAPTKRFSTRTRRVEIDWPAYEQLFLGLMHSRRIEKTVSPTLFDRPAVLLCSEATPEQCHRRLVVEYLNGTWGDVRARHL